MFDFPDDIVDSAKDACDVILNNIGRNWVLYFPYIPEETSNLQDSLGNKKNNRQVYGGPGTVGPNMSYGEGFRASENTTTIKLDVDWEPKFFNKGPTDVRIPDGVIMVQGFIGDLPKLLACDYLIVQEIQPYRNYRYKLYGEPIDAFQLTQGKYFVAYLQRVG
jgi:hypothetical protein